MTPRCGKCLQRKIDVQGTNICDYFKRKYYAKACCANCVHFKPIPLGLPSESKIKSEEKP